MTISGAAISGNTAEYALIENTCVSAVVAGSSCALTVQFTPSGGGARPAASLVYSSNGTNGPAHSIPLSGVGAAYPLLTPNSPAVGSCKHSAWLATGYNWMWTASNGCLDAGFGTFRFQTLVANNTGANMTVRVHAAADNGATLYVDGAQASPARHYSSYTVWPYYDVVIAPGTHRFELHVVNDGTTNNPAAFSAAFVNVGTGAVIRSTNEVSLWSYY